MKIDPKSLSDFDVMIAGFPCQTFSIVGQRKGMKEHRGQVIYGLIDILKAKNVSYFILENVKGLVNHERGETLGVILDILSEAGYNVRYKVLDSIHYGVPQMRERIYFVGALKTKSSLEDFVWPKASLPPSLQDYLVDEDTTFIFNTNSRSYQTFLGYLENKYNKGKFTLKNLLEEDYLVLDTRQSDLRLYRGRVPTLRTGRHGILYVRNKQLRKLSAYESLLLQGFPIKSCDKVRGKIEESHILRQTGNAMTVTTIESIGRSLLSSI
jgi:DNA (cytosine-5)-methyltransferase 1